ncbi:MAG TPA: mechanosensitive ion channel family protein [Longimicrobiales bacterium]|nr:mechanosensitive ion channel family protein [Longimicrobiales bacterium]
MNQFLEHQFYDNTAGEWGMAAVIAAVVLGALWAMEWLVIRRVARFAEKTRFTFDDVVVATLRATRFWMLLLIALWAGSLALTLPEETRDRLGTLVQLALVLQAAFWGNAAIRAWVTSYSERRAQSDPSGVTTMRAMGVLGRLLLWAVLALSALAALGIDVTALVAGLGIGGIAIALAIQNILGDLFASLSIVLDKPFVIGDFIIVGDMMGTVENIGLKTTRVRSLSGEQLVFSNSDLLSSRIRNYKRMYERRVLFTVGVTYQTPRAKLIEIPQRIRAIIEAEPDTRFDRAHFAGFGASSLDFEIVYYTKDPDYNVYRDRHQDIALAIHQYFEAEGIEFAYPTQTVFLAGGGERARAET